MSLSRILEDFGKAYLICWYDCAWIGVDVLPHVGGGYQAWFGDYWDTSDQVQDYFEKEYDRYTAYVYAKDRDLILDAHKYNEGK